MTGSGIRLQSSTFDFQSEKLVVSLHIQTIGRRLDSQLLELTAQFLSTAAQKTEERLDSCDWQRDSTEKTD